MRDILNDLETGKSLSDPDPVRRAQIQMRTPLPRRFYKTVSTAKTEGGFVVHLDGRPVRTPARAIMTLPTEKAARLVADEFAGQGEYIDPMTMPVMRLVNSAVDGVASDVQPVIADILRYSGSDLLCYRADSPQALVNRQAESWDPVIGWARSALRARLMLAEGVMFVEQPPEAIAAIEAHLSRRSQPFVLAALHLMTALTGSALLAMAVEAGAMSAEAAWAAAHLDEDWNAEQWGMDAEAARRRASRQRDFMAAIRLLDAVKQ